MKKLILTLFIVILFFVGVFIFTKERPAILLENVEEGYKTFSSKDLGIEFAYKDEPDGYILTEKKLNAGQDPQMITTLVLTSKKDNLESVPEGGEYPPTITLLVFENSEKLSPEKWAEKNNKYSNISLKIGETSLVSVERAKGIRYMADGLYRSDNVLITHGESVYLIIGNYLDENSDIRNDFQPLIDSVKFIPKENQE